MNIFAIIALAVVQGLAELLPVSSSAHVIVAEKLMGFDPTSPEMTLLIVMLHTGTMFAVIVYFWSAWRKSFFASTEVFLQQAIRLGVATLATGAIGYPLIKGIELAATRFGFLTKDASGKIPNFEIEQLFGNLAIMSAALAAAGVLIVVAGLVYMHRQGSAADDAEPSGGNAGDIALAIHKNSRGRTRSRAGSREIGIRESVWIGAVQGLCLPLRGFSRSGSTISTGLLLGGVKARVEEFSFALAVILTPAVVAKEAWRLIKARHDLDLTALVRTSFGPSLLGMVCAFLAGLVALRWLSRWLEAGRWHFFGIYCLVAAAAVFALRCYGY